MRLKTKEAKIMSGIFRKEWSQMAPDEKLDELRDQVQSIWKVISENAMGHQNLMSGHERTARTLQEVATELEMIRERVDRLAGQT
jgi:hypothetical protein